LPERPLWASQRHASYDRTGKVLIHHRPPKHCFAYRPRDRRCSSCFDRTNTRATSHARDDPVPVVDAPQPHPLEPPPPSPATSRSPGTPSPSSTSTLIPSKGSPRSREASASTASIESPPSTRGSFSASSPGNRLPVANKNRSRHSFYPQADRLTGSPHPRSMKARCCTSPTYSTTLPM